MISNILANEYSYFIFLMIIAAIPVGFFAGLFGIGGGLITVPFLFFIFESVNIVKSYIMHLAVGTSFSIIIPTSIVSVLTHKKHKSVDMNIVKTYGGFVISGVLAGTIFAALMQTKTLVLFFSFVVYFLVDIEREIFNEDKCPTREEIAEKLLEYLYKEVKLGTKVNHIMRHTVGLYHGQVGSKNWKRYLSDNMMARDSDFQKAKHIMTIVQNNEKANQKNL